MSAARTTLAADLRRLKVHREVPPRDVPYVPTDEPVVAAMLRFAGLNANDTVYDLGCGDGRIVIAAAKHFGCRGVGVDIDPLRIQESRENAKKARMDHLVTFRRESFFDTDLGDASTVMLYLLPAINCRLRPKFLSEMRPGSRIVANYFDMGDWKPDMTAEAHHRQLFQWIVPADVSGRWKCILDDPEKREHMVLHLKRQHQLVTGFARLGGTNPTSTPRPCEHQVINGRLFGDQLTFKLRMFPHTPRFSCRVEGRQMRGIVQRSGDALVFAWGGIWTATSNAAVPPRLVLSPSTVQPAPGPSADRA